MANYLFESKKGSKIGQDFTIVNKVQYKTSSISSFKVDQSKNRINSILWAIFWMLFLCGIYSVDLSLLPMFATITGLVVIYKYFRAKDKYVVTITIEETEVQALITSNIEELYKFISVIKNVLIGNYDSDPSSDTKNTMTNEEMLTGISPYKHKSYWSGAIATSFAAIMLVIYLISNFQVGSSKTFEGGTATYNIELNPFQTQSEAVSLILENSYDIAKKNPQLNRLIIFLKMDNSFVGDEKGNKAPEPLYMGKIIWKKDELTDIRSYNDEYSFKRSDGYSTEVFLLLASMSYVNLLGAGR